MLNTLFESEPLAAGAQPGSCQLASVPGNGPGHILFSNIDAVRMSMRICISSSVQYQASFLRTELPRFPLARSSANAILKCPVFSKPPREISLLCSKILHCSAPAPCVPEMEILGETSGKGESDQNFVGYPNTVHQCCRKMPVPALDPHFSTFS